MKAFEILKELMMFLFLIIIQVSLLNSIVLFGVAMPILYIYFIIKLPFGRNKYYVIISAFLMGLIIDIFLNTPGMNAAAITIIATFRPQLLNLFYPKTELETTRPGIHNAMGPFLKYVISIVVLHHTILFLVDALTLFDFETTMLRIMSSSIITTIIIISLDSIFYSKEKLIG